MAELRMSVNGEVVTLLNQGEYYRLKPSADDSLRLLALRRANNCF